MSIDLFATVLDCAGRPLRLDRARVVGIINLTPDSFSGDGQQSVDAAVAQGMRMARGRPPDSRGGLQSTTALAAGTTSERWPTSAAPAAARRGNSGRARQRRSHRDPAGAARIRRAGVGGLAQRALPPARARSRRRAARHRSRRARMIIAFTAARAARRCSCSDRRDRG
ncbi:MAG: hypothetical protein WDW36_004053 [Sanguina aurantia]